MADISDVENALVTAISAAIYPNGTGQASAIGAQARIYRGWPDARALDADLAAGVVNVSIFPQRGMTRNTTRVPLDYLQTVVPTPTITVATGANTVTFAGAAGAGNLCGIRNNGVGYSYVAQPTDTPTIIAAALAALVPGATASGAVVTIAAPVYLLGRVVAYGTSVQETRRQEQGFLISVWCSTVTQRDTTTGVVDAALAPIEFLTLADGTGGRLIYRNTMIDDAPTKDALWRRDLVYTVEYPTTLITPATQVLWPYEVIATGMTLPGTPTSSTITTSPS